jgi:CheY-like chemotaxis protein
MSGVARDGHGPRDGKDAASVLVIDDDDDVREALVLLLDSAGYPAVGAANGDDALAMLRGGADPP